MPKPKNIDLIPAEIRDRLKEALAAKGFGDIVGVTATLNDWLADEGLEISVGKSAVGEYSKLLKDQRDAFTMAETLLADMDIEQEGEMHKVLMQMIATSAMHMMRHVRDEDGHLQPKDLMALGRMLKDLMASAGIREKLQDDERKRIASEAKAAAVEELEGMSDELGFSADTVQAIRAKILGVRDAA